MIAQALLEEIESDASGVSEGVVYRRVLPETAFDVTLELRVGQSTLRLLVAGRQPVKLDDEQHMRGLRLSYSTDDGKLRVELTDARFRPLFVALLDDLFATLTKAATSDDPVEVVLARLLLWRRLFQDSLPDGLTPEQQRGLLGELLCLRDVVLPSLPELDAVQSWMGPRGAPQDFRTTVAALEVKTRFRRGDLRIRISSEVQLDTGELDLFLTMVTLDVIEGSGQSLNETVDDVRSRLEAVEIAQMMFNDALLQAGYVDAQRQRYASPTYVGSLSFFSVVSDFPKIVRQDLRPGIANVAYDIDLAACAPYAVSSDRVKQALRSQRG